MIIERLHIVLRPVLKMAGLMTCCEVGATK